MDINTCYISYKMVLKYKGIGIHHSYFTVTTIRYRI